MLARFPARPAGFIEPCLPTLARAVPGGSPPQSPVGTGGRIFSLTGELDRALIDFTEASASLNQVVSATLANDGTSSSAGCSVTMTNIVTGLRLTSAFPERVPEAIEETRCTS
jgi:hypothetical protein